MNEEVVFLLTRGYLPGTVLQAIDGVSFVETTVREAAGLVGDSLMRILPERLSEEPGRRAWLVAAYGQLRSGSSLGGSSGYAGTLWILAVPGGTVLHGYVERSVRIGPPYEGQHLARGLVAAVDARRVPSEELVRDTTDAVNAAARFLYHVHATITDVAFLYTSAGRAGELTGIHSELTPTKTGGWIFEARGNFQLICGGSFHNGQSSLRLLVFEGRSSPYILDQTPPGETPLATLGATLYEESHPITPGEFPSIDRFWDDAPGVDATATALAGMSVIPCPDPDAAPP